jgi:short-chain Z-isoprenyl diphosphate synthase
VTPLGTFRNVIRLGRLRRELQGKPRPRHVGIVMDGNRRWARAEGHLNPSMGHRVGAEHIENALRWSERWGIEHLTIYVLSAANIRKRSSTEIDYLMELLETVVPAKVLSSGRPWTLHVAGDPSLLPASTAAALRHAAEASRELPCHLTLAIGYDGRQEIADAARAAVRRSGNGQLAPDDITSELGGGPVKEIDLVIRTSGEQRLSGFFPWQVAYAELFTSAKMWPDFGEVDFAAALHHYAGKRSTAH